MFLALSSNERSFNQAFRTLCALPMLVTAGLLVSAPEALGQASLTQGSLTESPSSETTTPNIPGSASPGRIGGTAADRAAYWRRALTRNPGRTRDTAADRAALTPDDKSRNPRRIGSDASADRTALTRPGNDPQEVVHYDFVNGAGALTGGRLFMPIDPAVFQSQSRPEANNRIDLVTVGDGFTARQQGQYVAQATDAIDTLFSLEPFNRYRYYFAVHHINVISNESGIDHDPAYGILRDTALDMGFWGNKIERMLSVNVAKAYKYASQAPEVDQVLAIANSRIAGGAAYSSSELVTIAGNNQFASQLAIHEFGHSLGNLADEYAYANAADTHSGTQPSFPNVSNLQTDTASSQIKWGSWLRANEPQFDGPVSIFEGGAAGQFDLHIPSENSVMRSLGRLFNLPSAEALIIEMYKIVSPIDDATPAGEFLQGTETIFVDPMPMVRTPFLSVQWSLDGLPIRGATDNTLDLSTLCLTQGDHTVSVVVTDPTPWVRDEAARKQWLSDARSWTVHVTCAAARLAAPANFVDGADLLVVIQNWGQSTSCGDISPRGGDGIIDANDLLAVTAAFGKCQ